MLRDFRVTMYDHRLMQAHHDQRKHEYLVSNSVLDADLIINLAKLKCHSKAGITGALKNLVGINGHKEYLPHHTNGSPAEGGDQYACRSMGEAVAQPALRRLLGTCRGARNGAQRRPIVDLAISAAKRMRP